METRSTSRNSRIETHFNHRREAIERKGTTTKTGLCVGVCCTLLAALTGPVMGADKYFTAPKDGTLHIKPVGGSLTGPASQYYTIEFGDVALNADGTVRTRRTLFQNLPDDPTPSDELVLGTYNKGDVIHFWMRSCPAPNAVRVWPMNAWTLDQYNDAEFPAGAWTCRRCFTDIDNHLKLDHSIYVPVETGSVTTDTWIMHLDYPGEGDDAVLGDTSVDDDRNVLVRLRYLPSEPNDPNGPSGPNNPNGPNGPSGPSTPPVNPNITISSYDITHSFMYELPSWITTGAAVTAEFKYSLLAEALEPGIRDSAFRVESKTLGDTDSLSDSERAGTSRPDVRFSDAGAEAGVTAWLGQWGDGLYRGAMKSTGTVQSEPNKPGHLATAASEIGATIRVRSPRIKITWWPSIVSASTSAGTLKDPIHVTTLDQQGNPLWSECLFDVSIEQSGDLNWGDCGLDLSGGSGLDVGMHISMVSEYLATTGTLDFEVHEGVVTMSGATGCFAEVGLPAVEEYVGGELHLPMFPSEFVLEYDVSALGVSELLIEVGGGGEIPADGLPVIDDFESYSDDLGGRIYEYWIDGWDDPDNGSQAGHSEMPFAEQQIVHRGHQSMPLYYNNTADATDSYAVRSLRDDVDWLTMRALSLAVHGDADNQGGQFYVLVNDKKVHVDIDLSDPAWQEVEIDLETFGVDPENIESLGIGVSGAGSSGLVYIDDIRLLP